MIKMFSIVILIATGLMVGWIIWTFVHAWATETGSWWQKTLAAGKDSAVIVWSKFVLVVAGIVAMIDQIATVAGDPSLGDQLKSALQPQYVAYATMAIMVINVWARLRTLK